ncbi:hypothetical protein PTTG_30856, partial [Puccinia triticina 1-1 BBBD Race 1]
LLSAALVCESLHYSDVDHPCFARITVALFWCFTKLIHTMSSRQTSLHSFFVSDRRPNQESANRSSAPLAIGGNSIASVPVPPGVSQLATDNCTFRLSVRPYR